MPGPGLALRLVLGALLLAPPAAAQTTRAPFDIGLAQIGMRLNQLRFAAWPANTRLVCSQDPDKPPGAERTPLALPPAMVSAGVSRCALFVETVKDQWVPRPVVLAGTATEFWFLAILDEQGTERVFQMTGRQPIEAFGRTVETLSQRWGAPTQKTAHFVRWLDGTVEAQIADDSEGTLVFLFDTALHKLLDSRMPKPPPKPKKGKDKDPPPADGGEGGGKPHG
jgi:hypothetical protein